MKENFPVLLIFNNIFLLFVQCKKKSNKKKKSCLPLPLLIKERKIFVTLHTFSVPRTFLPLGENEKSFLGSLEESLKILLRKN